MEEYTFLKEIEPFTVNEMRLKFNDFKINIVQLDCSPPDYEVEIIYPNGSNHIRNKLSSWKDAVWWANGFLIRRRNVTTFE